MESVLHAFEVLGEDGFHDAVLAPLIKAGTAANLTLACKGLRQLSQNATRELHFSSGSCLTALARIPERFPCCRRVSLYILEPSLSTTRLSWQSYHGTSLQRHLSICSNIQTPLLTCLDAGCSLPWLQSLRVNILGEVDLMAETVIEPGYIAMFLELIRMQLTSLTSLDLNIEIIELDWEANTALFDVLSRFSQLQSLNLNLGAGSNFYAVYQTNLPLHDLGALSSIPSLSSLTVQAVDLIPSQDYKFVSTLTALTHLELPLILPEPFDETPPPLPHAAPPVPPPILPLASFTALQSLRSLVLADRGEVVGPDPPLTGSECSCLAQLTGLTRLELGELLQGLADSQDVLQQLLHPLQELKVR